MSASPVSSVSKKKLLTFLGGGGDCAAWGGGAGLEVSSHEWSSLGRQLFNYNFF